jgi:hypothetical protein
MRGARLVRIGVADQVKKFWAPGRRQKPGGFYDVRWFRADDRGKLVGCGTQVLISVERPPELS